MDYINVNTIIERVKRNPLLEDIPYETIIDHAIEFIKIMGIPASFIEKTDVIDISEYRGELPCDFYRPIQVRTLKKDYFRGSTDSFHTSERTESKVGFTYKIQGNVIITSIPECKIEIAYTALPMDDDGLPLIPDNGSYPRALQEYITVECYTVLFDQGKITPQVLQNRQLRYQSYARQATTDLVIPTVDQMVSISNMWNRLLPSKKDYNNAFSTLGAKEVLKRH